MVRYFLRLKDPLRPVYSVDHEAGVWSLVRPSNLGLGGPLDVDERRDAFLDPSQYQEMWRIVLTDGQIAFTSEEPKSGSV